MEVKRLGRVRKKRIRWEPSSGGNVSMYRLYWAKDGDVSYASEHADLGTVTEVILPDDVPSFPPIAGQIGLGITALNEAGNESDITKTTAHLNFIAPAAPADLRIEDAEI